MKTVTDKPTRIVRATGSAIHGGQVAIEIHEARTPFTWTTTTVELTGDEFRAIAAEVSL